MKNDTIAAISTPTAMGGIGIIRMSGVKSKEIAEKVFSEKIKESHTIRYGFLLEPETEKQIDEVLLTYMKAPKTYTREDIVEINCHSGVAVLNRIMQILLQNGARQAEPGEFTKRAFLNGRIDLTRAEAVSDIIKARTESARRSACVHLSGKLFEDIKRFMDRILVCLANIEAEIDYPEHFEDGEQTFFLRRNIDELLVDAKKLYRTSERGRIIREGVNTVIIGDTNVGKSSLLNYFVGCERAIVTDVHGTTRDSIEESVSLNGVFLKLTDTAGIRETEDPVEKIGVMRANEAAKAADLLLYLFDASLPAPNNLLVTQELTSSKIIALINKSDLEPKIDAEYLKRRFGEQNVLKISIKSGHGLSELETKIKDMFYGGELEYDEPLIANLRQKTALGNCINSLKRAMESIESGFPDDVVSVDLMEAYASLGEITGETLDENLTDKIFSEFCLGK